MSYCAELGATQVQLKNADRAIWKKKQALDQNKVDLVSYLWKPLRTLSKPFVDRGLASSLQKKAKSSESTVVVLAEPVGQS